MTAAGLHHLPSDDGAPVRLVLEALAKLGVTPTEGQRRTLAVAHEYGWLTGPDGLARIIADCSPEARAARARQRVRASSINADPAWRLRPGGFRCLCCGRDFGGYVDPMQANAGAADHLEGCTGGGTDV